MDAQPTRGEAAAPLDELRRLIAEPDREEIAAIKRRVEAPIDPEALSTALPEAVVHAWQTDKRLAKAIAPPVEEALSESIRRSPRALAELLFPIIGPAIRRSIANALRAMQEALNEALEKTVSANALHWRLEAWRTGRPYGEVVMANTLQYRVTHVFLIHADSGLLLGHAAAEGEPEIEPELTSGMLQAILSFARESFGKGGEKQVDQVRIGDFNLVVDSGPRAILAASVQGYPSPALTTALADALETIHLEHGDRLRSFDGNTEPFATARPLLQSCLMQERAVRPASEKTKTSRTRVAVIAALLALFMIPAVWFLRLNAGWGRYLDRLHAEPGYLVLDHARRGLHFEVRGLRDPLARPLQTLHRESGISPGRLVERWDSFASGSPPLALIRARRILAPPPSIRLTMKDGKLLPVGAADHAWLEAARNAEPLLPGGTILSFAQVIDTDRVRLAELLKGLPSKIPFVLGAAVPQTGATKALRDAAGRLREVPGAADRAGQRVVVELVGESDAVGSEAENRALRRRRGAWLRDYLVAHGVAPELLTVSTSERGSVAERSVRLVPRVSEGGGT